jgi:glycosyltransferase involved in cell wall biosynthesis
MYRMFKPDVVHAHSAKAGGLVRLLRRFGANPRVLYTPHAYYGLGRSPSLSVRFFSSVERFLGPMAVTINLSPDEADYGRTVLRLQPSLQQLIPNGVNTRHFAPGSPAERLALRAEFGMPPNAVVVGSLGRFSYQKDPMTLHRAFRACADLMPDLHLVHVGTGELRDEVQKYARTHGYANRVVWIDYLRDPAPFYRMLDCFVLTSRYEGLSFAALEAMATNIPLLMSDAPGNRGFTSLGLSHFWIARAEYPASFASAITSWYDDRAHARPCNHQDVATAGFSCKLQFTRIEAAYARSVGAAAQKTEQSAHPART